MDNSSQLPIPDVIWSQMSDEQKMDSNPDRFLLELADRPVIFQDEPNDEIEQAQRTPSQVEEDIQEEDSSEINEHTDGGEFNPVSWNNRPTHRLPRHLVNVKALYWFGTHNDPEYLDIEELNEICSANVQVLEWFIIYKETAPSTGHTHYHSLVVLKKSMQAHTCIEIDPRGSWEKVRGQLKTAFNYIRKDGNKYFEWGRLPAQIQSLLETEERNERKRKFPTKTETLWKDMVARAKQGDESIRDEMLYARNMSYFDQLLAASHENKRYQDDLKAKNLWIVGPPGTGKSRLVWDYCEEQGLSVYVKLQNKWWDGYNKQKVVLIDDAGDNLKVLAFLMKNWADRYPFSAEVKGGTRMINGADFYFVVTSNYHISDIFNATDAEAIERRFDVLEMK